MAIMRGIRIRVVRAAPHSSLLRQLRYAQPRGEGGSEPGGRVGRAEDAGAVPSMFPYTPPEACHGLRAMPAGKRPPKTGVGRSARPRRALVSRLVSPLQERGTCLIPRGQAAIWPADGDGGGLADPPTSPVTCASPRLVSPLVSSLPHCSLSPPFSPAASVPSWSTRDRPPSRRTHSRWVWARCRRDRCVPSKKSPGGLVSSMRGATRRGGARFSSFVAGAGPWGVIGGNWGKGGRTRC
jgi:hypothetical protein